jgi:transglutaminase-like putative cysteine protease
VTPDPASGPRQAPRRAPRRPIGVVSLAPLILSVSAAIPLSRLIHHPMGDRVLLPIVVAIVLADVVTALGVRLGAAPFPAIGLGWLASVCGLLVLVDPTLFHPGSAHFLHLGLIDGQLGAAHRALAADGTPLPLTNGVVLVVSAIGAAAAALTRATWARGRHGQTAETDPATAQTATAQTGRRALAPCMAPTFAIFVYSTLVSAEQERVVSFVSYFVGVVVFLALSDRSASPVTSPPDTTSPLRPLLGAMASLAVMALVVIAAGAGLSGMRLTVFHVPPPAPRASPSLSTHGVAGDLLTGIALVDNLRAVEVSQSKEVVLRARSPVTTYWQVGTLSSFTGSAWVPTAGASAALTGTAGVASTSLGPGALPSPSPVATFSAQVTITDFVSRLLPAPPDALAVHGLAGAEAIEQEGVLADVPSAPGTSYTVTAGQSSIAPSDGRQLASTDPRLVPFLALPAQPAVVAQLARQAVGGATTPADQAQALVNWFRSGRFRYTLSPPPTSGPDPLVQFLTVTKAGFCEQFAGAYAVLARSLGIPTRLAVGFTAGQPGPGDTYTVTGADAHVWPQVYLGPDAGWVSVEPTPPVASAPVPPGVLGPSATPPGQSTGSTTTAAPQVTPTTSASSASHPVTPPATNEHSSRRHSTAPRHHGLGLWILVLALVAALVVLALVLWGLRDRRTAAEARLPPDQRVVRSWEHALRALRRQGLSRQVGETPGEYAARISAVEGSSSEPVEADAVAHLAELVELACYTPRQCTPGQADQARALASTIVATNRPHRARRRRPTERHNGGPE